MPSSSLFQRSSTTLVSLALLSSTAVFAAPAPGSDVYILDQKYEGTTFFNEWNFFSGPDPTHGFVDYLSYGAASGAGLVSAGPSSAQMRVDSATRLTAPKSKDEYYNKDNVGRKSVRIESSKQWTYGLFIADINHMPSTSNAGCGTWPAFWTLGPDPWPTYGEIDIIEGANDQQTNTAASHVAGKCSINNNGITGSVVHPNCNYNDVDPWGNYPNPTGCQVSDPRGNSYGAGFNRNQGGVYALEWTNQNVMNTYFFPRGSIPADIAAGTPDTSKWGKPFGSFAGSGCNVDQVNVKNLRLVVDTTFCGDFGDATWGNGCAAKTGYSTCAAYVAENPRAFTEAYWDFRSIKVYKKGKPPVTSTTTSSTTTTKSTTTSSSTTASTTPSTTATTTASTTPSTTTTGYTRSSSSSSTTVSVTTSASTTTSGYTKTTSASPATTTTSSSTISSSSSVTPTTTVSKTTASSSVTPSSSYTSSYGSSWSDAPFPTSSTTSSKPVDATSSTYGSWSDAPFPTSSTTSSKPVDPTSSTYGSWSDAPFPPSSTTSSKPVDPTSSTYGSWSDAPFPSSSTTSSKPVDATTSKDYSWSDASKPVDPTSSTYASWSDVVVPTSTTSSKHADPTHWSDASKPVDPTSTANPTWSDIPSDSTTDCTYTVTVTEDPTHWSDAPLPATSTSSVAHPWSDASEPVDAASSASQWSDAPKPIVPTSTIASWSDLPVVPTTIPVVPVDASSAKTWADAAAPTVSPVKPVSPDTKVATYTGAASGMTATTWTVMAAAILAGAALL